MRRRAQTVAHAARADAGFTLIELLVSVALLALILLMTQSALRFGQRTWDVADDIEQSDTAAAAIKFLEQRLAQTMPLYEREVDGRLHVAFRGFADRLSFIAPASSGPAGGGLYRFELTAPPNPNGGQSLALDWFLYQPVAAVGQPERRVLIRNIEDFSLRFLGRLKPDDQPVWVSEWNRSDVLPDLVEVRFLTRLRQWTSPVVILVELRLRPPRQG